MATNYPQPVFRPPPGATDLLLIRHGTSEPARPEAPFPLVDGQGDPALAPEGRVQADLVADRLKKRSISALYVTNLRRTHQTCAPLASELGLTPIEDRDLREVHLGDWEGGLYRQKVAENDPVYLRARASGEWGEIPGAETTAAFTKRVAAALARIAGGHPDQLVAAVAHGGTIAVAMALATGTHPFVFAGVSNGAITRLVLTEDRMIVRGFNDCAHLEDA